MTRRRGVKVTDTILGRVRRQVVGSKEPALQMAPAPRRRPTASAGLAPDVEAAVHTAVEAMRAGIEAENRRLSLVIVGLTARVEQIETADREARAWAVTANTILDGVEDA